MSLERERRKLDRTFKAILLALGSPAIVVACGVSDVEPTPEGPLRPTKPDASVDATIDAAPSSDSGVARADGGLDATASADALDGSSNVIAPLTEAQACFGGAYEVDGGDGGDGGDAQDICAFIYNCGLAPSGFINVGCGIYQSINGGAQPFPPPFTCWVPEGPGCDNDVYVPGEGGAVTFYCFPCPNGGGRRPAGLRAPRGSRGRNPMGAYLAGMAFEEGASVIAFERMRGELASLGAPESLVTGASRAACDERRHARVMSSLARARGGCLTRPRSAARRRRGVTAMAAENAAEGCVRETYGALLARWQSVHARDPEVRKALVRIAADEARHAALSWALARWIEPQLDAAGQRRVSRARARALEALTASVAVEPQTFVATEAGLPSAQVARRLLEEMSRALGLEGAPVQGV